MGNDTNRTNVSRFTRALNTINAALEANRDKTPYKQLIEAAEKVADDTTYGVAVYEDDASKPFDYYTVRFRDGSLELVKHGKQEEPDLDWKVSRAYLDDVASNEQRYVENPARLDWDWIKSRLGIG